MHQELINSIHTNNPTHTFIDKHLNVYLLTQYNKKISTTIYNLTKTSLTQFFITNTSSSKLFLLGASITNNGLKFCVADSNSKYNCKQIKSSHKKDITLSLNQAIQPIDNNNISTLTKKSLWISKFQHHFRFCSLQKSSQLYCINDNHSNPGDTQKYAGIGKTIQNDILSLTGFYNPNTQNFSIHESKISVQPYNNDQKASIISDLVQKNSSSNATSALFVFKQQFLKDYKNLALVNLNEHGISISNANKKINEALKNNSIVLIEGKPEFINKLQPNAVPFRAGANLLLAVKEADNIYHIRTLNYEEKQLTANPESYLNSIAKNTNQTIKNILSTIKK